jgi:hypothetical protein
MLSANLARYFLIVRKLLTVQLFVSQDERSIANLEYVILYTAYCRGGPCHFEKETSRSRPTVVASASGKA